MGKINRQIEDSIIIEKDVRAVWDTLTSFSNYRTWNPAVSHAAIYGPLSPGTRVKILSGKWDFDFVIKDVSPLKRLEMEGRSIGVNLNINCELQGDSATSKVLITGSLGGLLPGIFKKKLRRNLEESLTIFLNAIKRRVLSDNTYRISRDDSQKEEDEQRSVSMPSPFNLLYKTRSRKSRKVRYRLK
jgi:hypothetical protein